MGQSWSAIRKRLEQEFLCEALRGRVQYFFTIYHNAPDDPGRFAVRVDGRELWNAHAFCEGAYDRIAREIKAERQVPRREWDGKRILHDEENLAAEALAVQAANERGIASSWDAMGAVEEYLNLGIAESLRADNPIVRMLAVLDRRAGKRTLKAMREDFMNGPAWLREFYLLRLRAEGLAEN